MSFDLFVWHSPIPSDSDHVMRITEDICENEGESETLRCPEFEAFMDEIERDTPQLQDVADDEIENCPWAFGPIERANGGALLNIQWSHSDATRRYVLKVASRHGLIVYDPQSDETIIPPSRRNGAQQRKPWWRFWS